MFELSPQEIKEKISSIEEWKSKDLDAVKIYENIDFSGIDFSNTSLHDRKFYKCKLNGCNFTSSNLRESKFQYCELNNSIASYSINYFASFSHCSIENSRFYHCNFSGASFKRCSLINTSFQSSILNDNPFIYCTMDHKTVKTGKLYLLNDLEVGSYWSGFSFKKDQIGLILKVEKNGDFDILVDDKIIRSVGAWVKYTGIARMVESTAEQTG